MIPRLIHQTAKTADVGPKWLPLQKKLLELHPDWTYKLWTDIDNLALIRERRPDLEAVYLGMPQPIQRADLRDHPPMPRSNRDLKAVLANPETQAIHWCFGMWRALTLWSRLKNRLKRLKKWWHR